MLRHICLGTGLALEMEGVVCEGGVVWCSLCVTVVFLLVDERVTVF